MSMDKEGLIRDSITWFWQENGYAPTYREVGELVGVRSPATIHQLIQQMIDNGVLTSRPGRARTLRLVNHGNRGPV